MEKSGDTVASIMLPETSPSRTWWGRSVTVWEGITLEDCTDLHMLTKASLTAVRYQPWRPYTACDLHSNLTYSAIVFFLFFVIECTCFSWDVFFIQLTFFGNVSVCKWMIWEQRLLYAWQTVKPLKANHKDSFAPNEAFSATIVFSFCEVTWMCRWSAPFRKQDQRKWDFTDKAPHLWSLSSLKI